jgi:hypothetical protein
MTVKDTPLEAKLRAHGIIHPIFTVKWAEHEGLELASACAMLMMESSGGHNEFGHDGGNRVQGGQVTEARYKQLRAGIAAGEPSNGVGPCQLTSVGLLDEADLLGGAWIIEHNMTVGFHFLHGLQTEHGIEGGFVAYNGSGPAAVAYGARAMEIRQEFLEIIG